MAIQIRKAVEKDFPAVLALIREFAEFQKTPEKVTVTVEQMKEGQSLFHFFIAESGPEQIVGFASCFFAWFSWTGKNLYLDDLYVQPSFRQQKTGFKLFSTVMAWAIENQCINMRWQVSFWNENAIRFYKSLGAEIDDTERNCSLNLSDKTKSPSL